MAISRVASWVPVLGLSPWSSIQVNDIKISIMRESKLIAKVILFISDRKQGNVLQDDLLIVLISHGDAISIFSETTYLAK